MSRAISVRKDRQERLLNVASELFSRWGFDKTSVEDVAREAGISKGAVYLEFAGKEELFRAVLYRELRHYMEDWLRRFEADPGEWSFARMIRHSVASILANPMMRALMTRDRRIFGSFLRHDSELTSSVLAIRQEVFGELQKIGTIRDDIPPAVLAYLMSVICYGMISSDEVIPEAAKTPMEESLTALGQLLDRGLAPRQVKGRKQARAVILGMMEKMKTHLGDGTLGNP